MKAMSILDAQANIQDSRTGRFTAKQNTGDTINLDHSRTTRFSDVEVQAAAEAAIRDNIYGDALPAATRGFRTGATDLAEQVHGDAILDPSYDDVIDKARGMFARTREGFAEVDDLPPGYWTGVINTVAHLATSSGGDLEQAKTKAEHEIHRSIRYLPGE